MAARKIKIVYQDGREEIVKILPRAQVMTEQYLKGFTAENLWTSTYYMGWAALNSLQKTSLDYETWLNQVEEVVDEEDPEEPEKPIEEIPPTPPVQSGAVSSE